MSKMKRNNYLIGRNLAVLLTGLLLLLMPQTGSAAIIDFSTDQYGNSLVAGTQISNQYDDLFTLTVYSRTNTGVVFDSANPTGGDDDLKTPSWSNLGNAQDESLGNLLIIQEYGATVPDDEAQGGQLIFDFSESGLDINSFGFHLVDAEGSENYWVKLFNDTFDTGYLALNGDDLVFGDNSINKIDPYLASTWGWTSFDKAEVKFSGSGGIDNITLGTAPVPEPATMVLFGFGLIGLAGVGRRHLKSV